MRLLVSLAMLASFVTPVSSTTLGISADGRYFTLNGKPTFLNGISYYGGTGVSDPANVVKDADAFVKYGFNWIRVWTNWNDRDENIGVVTPDGEVREPYMARLEEIIRQCDRRGVIVDVTMSRGKAPSPSVQSQHLECAKTLAQRLKPYRNVYIDVGNERDVGDARHVPLAEVGELIAAVKAIDPRRICTASGTPGSKEELNEYLTVGRLDFIATHLTRDEGSSAKTMGTVRQFEDWMRQLGRRVPIHLQEPFRRGYAEYEPVEEDYYRDCSGAKIAGAAGWCLHNGSSRGGREPRLSRSFNMSAKGGRLFTQLDAVELAVCRGIRDQIGGTDPDTLRYQAEYPEQVAHDTGQKDSFAWAAVPGRDKAGCLARASVSALPSVRHVANWRLMVDAGADPGAEVARLEVVTAGRKAQEKTVRRGDFRRTGAWQSFSVDFKNAGEGAVGFVAYWPGACSTKLDHITLTAKSP